MLSKNNIIFKTYNIEGIYLNFKFIQSDKLLIDPFVMHLVHIHV